jgi:SAM-dependent methyltransferase
MSIENEMKVYDSAPVSKVTGETESFDEVIFPNVIRKIELALIKQVMREKQPTLVLDFGCGGGWLSLLLERWGYPSVGVDISPKMVQNAKIVCPEIDFVVCDAMRLPFKPAVFDFVIGISILHHLNLKGATDELKRVSFKPSTFLFMEPSLLNPFSAFGRKMFPMEAHTEGERPYTPNYLKNILISAGFSVEKIFSNFFIAFPLARFSKITNLNPPSGLVKLIYYFELFMVKIPIFHALNSNIVAILRE